MERIKFKDPQSTQTTEFYVLEQTMLNGVNYLLITEEEDGDSDAYILKEIGIDGEEITYEMVEEEDELDALIPIFEELLEDVNFEK